ncbi:MAG: hypothetical protein ABI410_20105 [Rhodoferax sp.]|uniref:hypothetical protein n=2 Tax=Rhodoferax sp. TaxID=50421 RepID=UPI0032670EB3
MLDSSKLSLVDFCFASRTRNNPAGKSRHTVDAFRTVCWFHCLRMASGATSTYQMDALIEERQTSGADTPVDRKNKWRSYRDGRHTPSTALAGAIERQFPGSHAVLDHPMWQLLRLDRSLQVSIPNLLSQLPPCHFAIVRSGSAAAQSNFVLTSDWSARRLRKLEREAGLDALACLIMLLRKALESGDSRQAHMFGRSLCRMLLLMGRWLYAHGIAQPMVNYVENVLLPMTAYEGCRYSFGEQGYLGAATQLIRAANMIEANENKLLTSVQKAELMLDLLDDKFSLELSALVTPIASPGT